MIWWMKTKRAKAKPRGKKARKTPSPKSKLGTLRQCAAALNLGERRVNQLVKEGLPKVAHGRYDVGTCLRWYVRYLQKSLLQRGLMDPDGGGFEATLAIRNQLLGVNRELKQIELAKKREGLISTERVQRDRAALFLEIKTRILALPPRLAAEVLGEQDLAVVQAKVDRSLKGALESLSHYNPSAPVDHPS
jgi:hypothetical protein